MYNIKMYGATIKIISIYSVFLANITRPNTALFYVIFYFYVFRLHSQTF